MEKPMIEISSKEKTPEQYLAEHCYYVTQKILKGWLENQSEKSIKIINEIIKIILENGEKK